MSFRFNVMTHRHAGTRRRWLPSASHRPFGPTCSLMQAKFVRRCPCSPMIVRHLYVCRSQEFEGVVYCIREARHAANIGALAHTFGTDRMMRRGVVVQSVSHFGVSTAVGRK